MLGNTLRALGLVTMTFFLAACSQFVGDNRHNVPLVKPVLDRLAEIGSSPSEPMVIRVYKQSSELEVWKRTNTGDYALFKTYPIFKWSGDLGPKIREGDLQSPEGFYDVTPALMNPKSSYWLSFNVGFPNKFDQAWGRTGTYLMIHGDCLSVGCYAMTDEGIKEIYALARETFRGGNSSFQLQLLPFRMTEANLLTYRFPRLLMPNNVVLPPVECSLGVNPSHAASSRARRNCRPSPTAASNAVAAIGPIPGMVMSRLALSSRSASASICLVTDEMR